MPEFSQFITWCFYGLITGTVWLLYNLAKAAVVSIVHYFKRFLEELQSLRKEMAELNLKITTIISDQGWMAKSIEKHEDLFKTIFDRLNSLDKSVSKGSDIGH